MDCRRNSAGCSVPPVRGWCCSYPGLGLKKVVAAALSGPNAYGLVLGAGVMLVGAHGL